MFQLTVPGANRKRVSGWGSAIGCARATDERITCEGHGVTVGIRSERR